MPGTSSIGGLISGLDTATLISQLMSVSRRRIDVVVRNQGKQSDKLAAYQKLNISLSDFKAKAEALKDNDTFNVFKAAASTNANGFKADDFLTVSTTSDASPGTHTITFGTNSKLAQARQLSSQSFSSKTALLNLSGDFVINGKGISISASDTLSDVAMLINNANSGSNATGVSATVLSVSKTDHRLILTSDNTGAGKFSLLDASSDTENILQNLGLINTSTAIKNVTSDGMQSDAFTNSGIAVKSLLGLSSANSGTVTIGGESVNINLETESLTTIANNINTVLAAASKGSAGVASSTTDGVTTYYIDISGTTDFTDDENVLQTLGIIKGQQGAVAEVHTASAQNTETSSGTGTSITSVTTFALINTGSDSNNVTNGDTIAITGTKHDGTVASGTYTISDGFTDTIQDLLTAIETTFGLDAGSATISGNGEIIVTDSTAGESQLSVNLVSNNEGGGTLDFGTVTATTNGYNMETVNGQDASVMINGVVVSRSTNTIDDVISGVSIDLKQVQEGATVNLTISRDTSTIKSSVNDFISAYNTIIESINKEFKFDEEKKSAGVLSGESTLSTIKKILQSTLANTVPLLPSGSNALSLIGINFDKNGKLSLQDSTFMSKISSDFNAVKRIFVAEGTTTNSEVAYISHTNKTAAGEYAVTINTVGTRATITGTKNLSTGIGGATDTIMITDTATSRVATINLDGNGGGNATSLADIVSTINTELAAERNQAIVGSVVNYEGGNEITSSTAFSAIDGTSLQNGDVISFSGTSKTGKSINDTFTISDTVTDTIQDLLSAIESSYGNTVSATINSSGMIEVRDITAGDSLLSIEISEPSGRGLDFGTILETNSGGITGRYAMELTASSSANNFVLTHNSYGSTQGFTIDELNDTIGAEGTEIGEDVAGTINGEPATGVGQILTGDAPAAGSTTSIEGLVLRITSTETGVDGSKGNVKLTRGVAEKMFYNMDTVINSIDGLLTIRMDGLQNTIDNLQEGIDDMEKRLATEQSILEFKFVQLELNLSRLQSVSSFLSQQLGSLSKLSL